MNCRFKEKNNKSLIFTLIKTKCFCWVLAYLVFILPSDANSNFRWDDCSSGILDLDIKTIDVCEKHPDYILAASNNTIYLSTNGSLNWQMVFRIPGKKKLYFEEGTPKQNEFELEMFSRSDFTEAELRKEGVINQDETLDDLSDKELVERLIEHGLIEEEKTKKEKETFFEKKGNANQTHQICWDPSNCRYAYLATTKGIFVSEDQGHTWRLASRNFREQMLSVNDITVLSPSGYILVATDQGLYLSKNHGGSFSPLSCMPTKKKYISVERDQKVQDGFLLVSRTSYYVATMTTCREVIVTSGRKKSKLKYISGSSSNWVSVASDSYMWIFRKNGFMENISPFYWGNAEIRDIKLIDDKIFLATNRGVFRWNLNQHEGDFINSGVFDFDTRQLSIGCQSCILFAATNSGIMKYHQSISAGFTKDVLSEIGLPPLEKVIIAAIKFAELEIDQDQKWILNLKASLWIPEINFLFRNKIFSDTDYSQSKNIAISSGKIYWGPSDQSWQESDDKALRFEIKLKWYPKPFQSQKNTLKISNHIMRKLKKQVKLIKLIKGLYIKAIQKYRVYKQTKSPREKIYQKQEFNRLMAFLDALTGMYVSDNLNPNRSIIFEGRDYE